MEAKGHVVENARAAAAGLEEAFAAGTLRRTPALDAMLRDLAVALGTGDGDAAAADGDAYAGAAGHDRLGGKSAEAARFILRAIARELERA